MAKAKRPGKVFVDWSQNDRHKTTVCAYSLRIARAADGLDPDQRGTRCTTRSSTATPTRSPSKPPDVLERASARQSRRPLRADIAHRSQQAAARRSERSPIAWTSTERSRSSPARAAGVGAATAELLAERGLQGRVRGARDRRDAAADPGHDRRDRAPHHRRRRRRDRGADQPRQATPRSSAWSRRPSSTSARSTSSSTTPRSRSPATSTSTMKRFDLVMQVDLRAPLHRDPRRDGGR